MAGEATTQDQDLKAEFDAARLAGDHVRMAELGPRLWPEPAAAPPAREGRLWSEDFAAKLAAEYHTAPAVEDRIAPAPGPLSPRAVIAAVNAELEKGHGHQTERRRQELLAQRDQAYRDAFEESERSAEAESRTEQAPPRGAEYAVAPPPGRVWNAPAVDAVTAQLVGRAIPPADLARWMARGAALAQEEPGDAPPLDAAVIADARFALQVFLPERTMRAEVEKFLEETGLGNDEAFIRELAAKGAPLRQELEEARRDRYRLGTLNAGSREYVDTAAALAARYRKVYGGS